MKTVLIISVFLFSVAFGDDESELEAVYDFHLINTDREELGIKTLEIEYKDFSGYNVPQMYIDKYSDRTVSSDDSSVLLFDFGHHGLFDWGGGHNQFGPYAEEGALIQSVTMIPTDDSYQEVTINAGEYPPEGTRFSSERGVGVTLMTQTSNSSAQADEEMTSAAEDSSIESSHDEVESSPDAPKSEEVKVYSFEDYWWAYIAGALFICLIIMLYKRANKTSGASNATCGVPIVFMLVIAVLILWGTGVFDDKKETADAVDNNSSESRVDDNEPSPNVSTSEEVPDEEAIDTETKQEVRIAFSSLRAGNFEIFVMDVDGRNQTQLTMRGGSWPDWSPDGRRIAFHSKRIGNWEIFVMDADGSNQTQLTTGGGRGPRWSPDGRHITFHSNRTGNDEIFVMDADGQNLTRLTFNGGQCPAWCPVE